jgi:hypothetical protein
MQREDDQNRERDRVGLCRQCRRARVIRSDRGSTFYLCQASFADELFPKYPRLPVLSCSAFEAFGICDIHNLPDIIS